MKRKILLILLSLAVIICISLVFVACSQSEVVEYSELEMEEGIVYLTDYSVKYTSDEESPLGEVNESTLSEEKSGSVQTYYLVMDFDMQTAEDIPGMEWLTVTMKVLDADVVKATINYTNTSSTTEITADGETTITATYSLPEKAKELKNVSLVVELRSQNVGATDIIYSFESDSKPVAGYSEEDSTYILTDSSVTVKNTSLEYSLNEDGQSYTVSSVGTKSGSGTMYMPDTYNGLPVTAIGEYAFDSCTSMTKITLPDTITEIGKYAFHSCIRLTSIIIPDSVTSIGSSAFSNCASLTSITIPDSVTTIGRSAFSDCTALTEINFNATEMSDLTEENHVFYNAGTNGDGITVTIGANVTKIPDYMFYPYGYSPKITSVVFEENSKCTSIGSYAFYKCTPLTGVTIGDSVTAIGEYAFYNCTSLTSVYYAGTASQWASISFSDYSANPLYYACNLYFNGTLAEDVTLEGITSINSYAFYNCTSLASVTIFDSVTTIGEYTFNNCTSLKSVTIGDSVTSIGGWAFYGCNLLTSVYYSGTASQWAVISFGNGLANPLYYAGNLYLNGTLAEDVTLEGVTSINSYIFYGCSSLKKIIIPDSVTSIGEYAFYHCTSLKSVTIGDSVTSIGGWAFDGCTSLTSVYYTGTASQWASISFDNYVANPSYRAGSDLYLNGTLAEEITLEGITAINASAFYNCTSLTSVTIGEGVTTIGGSAFYNCKSLTSVTIGDSVTVIGDSAFSSCTSLTSVTIGNSVTTIGGHAFYNCTALTEINFNATEMNDLSYSNVFAYAGQSGDGITVTIGANVTKIPAFLFSPSDESYSAKIIKLIFEKNSKCVSIGDSAFRYCTSLTSITIPDSLTTICIRAFYACSALTEINFNATAMNDLSYNDYVFEYAGQSGDGITVTIGANVTRIPAYLFCPYGDSSHTPKIINVVFEENSKCETIGGVAFGYCTSLTSVTIPDSVTTIGGGAFRDCTSLTSIAIPDSVKSIGGRAFYNCSELTSIIIPDNVTAIGDSAFYGCSKLTNTKIGNSVATIGSSAFYDCTLLENVTIGDTVKEIRSDAFFNCTSLKEIHITNIATWCSISFSDTYANPLYYAGNLYFNGIPVTDLIIPDDVTSIGSYVFYNCSSLSGVTIPDSVTSIGSNAFYNCSSLTMVTIGDGVTTIGDSAFFDCISLISITIGSNVTSIGDSAFSGCRKLFEVCNLSSLTITAGSSDNGYVAYYAKNVYAATSGKSNLITIDDYTFYYENSIYSLMGYVGTEAELILPDLIINGENINYGISAYAFYNNTAIKSVIISDGVTSIGNAAFNSCTSLISITIGHGVTSIGRYVFKNCTALTEINFNATAMNNASHSELFDNAGQSGNGITVTIGANVTKVPAYLFYPYYSSGYDYSPKITSVVFEDNSVCTSIGNYAFSYCTSLESIIIPDSVTSIGNYAFRDCTSLTSITVSSGNTAYKSIDGNLYSYDGKTLIQYAIGKTDTSFTIPDSVTTIGEDAFYGCTSLTSIAIPDSVTTIGNSALRNCTSLTSVTMGSGIKTIGTGAFNYCISLTSVYYNGTASEWSAITFGNSTADPTYNGATVYYYAESGTTTVAGNYWYYDNEGNIKTWSVE